MGVPFQTGRSLAVAALLACAASLSQAGEVLVVSDVRAKLNLDGRVLGIVPAGQRQRLTNLTDGTHKLYVKDVATGEYVLFVLEIPRQNGKLLQATLREQAASDDVPAIKGKALDAIFQLHEDSLDTLEAMQRKIDFLHTRVDRVEGEAGVERPATPPGEDPDRDELVVGRRAPGPGVGVYGILHQLYTNSDRPNSRTISASPPSDMGSFELRDAYLGVAAPITDGWSARVETRWAKGGMVMTTPGLPAGPVTAQGQIQLERAYARREGRNFTLRAGKMFNPFGFWTPTHQPVQRRTNQHPLMFGNLFSVTQTGVTLDGKLDGGRVRWTAGYYNGDGAKPDEVDGNDNKGSLYAFELTEFMDGRLALAYNSQRDGLQANRFEKKWILSMDQQWKRFGLSAEYFIENSLQDSDSYYVDLSYDFSDKLTGTYRYDFINHDPQSLADDHRRELLDVTYAFDDNLKARFDVFVDSFGDPTLPTVTTVDLALTAAIGI